MKKLLIIVAFVLLTPFSLADSSVEPASVLHHVQDNIHCMARAIYHESKGEGALGMLAIGHVVNNRMLSRKYPSTSCGIIEQPGQFPWFRKKLNIDQDQQYQEALSIAWDVLTGQTKDPTNGALFFHSVFESPGWKMPIKKRIKNHIFY